MLRRHLHVGRRLLCAGCGGVPRVVLRTRASLCAGFVLLHAGPMRLQRLRTVSVELLHHHRLRHLRRAGRGVHWGRLLRAGSGRLRGSMRPHDRQLRPRCGLRRLPGGADLHSGIEFLLPACRVRPQCLRAVSIGVQHHHRLRDLRRTGGAMHRRRVLRSRARFGSVRGALPTRDQQLRRGRNVSGLSGGAGLHGRSDLLHTVDLRRRASELRIHRSGLRHGVRPMRLPIRSSLSRRYVPGRAIVV